MSALEREKTFLSGSPDPEYPVFPLLKMKIRLTVKRPGGNPGAPGVIPQEEFAFYFDSHCAWIRTSPSFTI